LEFLVSGFAQVNAVLYSAASVDELNPTTREPLNETTVTVPRARVRGAVRKGPWGAVLEIDGNTAQGTPAARLFSAEVSWDVPLPPKTGEYELPRLRFIFGLFAIPFGGELLELVPDRWFLEVSNTTRAYFPGDSDAGLKAEVRWRSLRLTVAAMNGAPIGDRAFAGRDPKQSRDFMGRFGVHHQLGGGLSLRAGISGLAGTGFHPGTQATKDVLIWVDANEDGIVQLSELQVLKGSPPTPSQTFGRFGLGADVSFGFELPVLGHGELYGEVVAANNLDRGVVPADPVAAGRDLRELGWYIGLLQQVTRHGMVGVRFDTYDPDHDAQEQQGIALVPINRTFSTLSTLIAWRYADTGRLTLQYDHNRNPLGRAPSGQPDTLAADRITLRAQVKF
jgi:hypothetical protein